MGFFHTGLGAGGSKKAKKGRGVAVNVGGQQGAFNAKAKGRQVR